MNPDSSDFAPQTVMFAKIRERLAQMPFEPFRLVTTSGKSYAVPTSDHASTLGVLRIISVARDDGSSVDLHALHVAAIEPLPRRRRRAA